MSSRYNNSNREIMQHEEKFSTTINSLGDPLHIVDRNLKILLINSAFEKWLDCLGIDKDIVGKTIFEAFPFLQNKVRMEYEQIFCKKEDLHTEESTYIEDREVITETRKIPLFKDGVVAQIITIIRDITEYKNNEKTIKESEEKYKLLTENINDLITVINEKFQIEYINEEVHKKVLGIEVKDAIGINVLDIVHPEDKEKVFNSLLKGIENKEGIIEIRVKNQNGKYLWFETKGKAILNRKGNSKGILISRDITNRKKAEQALIESEEKYRKLFENSPDIISLINPEGIILDINSTIEKFGLKKNDLIGQPYDKLGDFKSDQISKLKQMYKELLSGKEIKPEEFKVRMKDGSTVWFLCKTTIVKLGNEFCILGIAQNISEIKKAENMIGKELVKLKELDEIKNELITRTSHELKTPLTSILGSTELLLKLYRDKCDQEIRELIQIIDYGGKRLESLIKNTIDTSLIESKNIHFKKEQEDIRNLIIECVEEMIYLAKKRDISIKLNIPENFLINIDKNKIKQVIKNIIDNAIKNTPPNGIITLTVCKKNKYLELVIKDSGVGFTENEIQKIFQKFGKIERYGKDLNVDIRGPGLGLYLAKQIIEMHEGEIRAKSGGLNKGATFIIKLPLD